MRAFFLLLVLVNLVFFAYAHVMREGGGAENPIPQLQISPDKIKLMKATAGPVVERPKPAPPSKTATTAPSACLEWGIFAGPEVARAEAAIAGLELPQTSVLRTVVDTSGYWVYMPPLKTKADVDRKIGELKALGVTEFIVVQDQTPWRNAISLGIFKTDEAAQARLAELRAKGVRTALAERRENFLRHVVFLVREPDDAIAARLAEIKAGFPGSELKAIVCPAAEAAKG